MPIPFPGWSHLQPLPQPRYLGRVLIQNREKSFGRSLHRRISGIWWSQLRLQPLLAEPSRHSSYISIASTDIDWADLFKPAPYLLAVNQIRTKCLFQIRAQHTKEIHTHHHLRHNNGRLAHYNNRICPFCHSTPTPSNELHYLFSCSSTTTALEPMYTTFKKQLKRLSLPPWETLHDSAKLSLLLRSSLPLQMDKRKATQERWQLCTGNFCALVALKLSSTLNSLTIRSPVT